MTKLETPMVLNYFFTSKVDKEAKKEKIVEAILVEFDSLFKEKNTLVLFFTATKSRNLIKEYFHKEVYSLRENFKELLLSLYEDDFDEIRLINKDNEFSVIFYEETNKTTKRGKLVSIRYCEKETYEKRKADIKKLPFNEAVIEYCLDILKKSKELLTAKEALNILKSDLSEVFVQAIMQNEDSWDKNLSLKENNVLEDIKEFWEEYILNNPIYLDLKESVYFIYKDADTLDFRFTNSEVIYSLTRTSKVVYDWNY